MEQLTEITSTSIVISNLTVEFDKTVAVTDLDLHINQKELFVLLGPSGCGKSTTLNSIAGLIKPSKGMIHLGEKLVTNMEENIFVRPQDRNLAMVFQDYAIYPHMTVYDNIAFPLETLHVEKATIPTRVKQAAERLDIGHLLDRKPKQLSGGQRQRVALARAIVRNPTAFLMDEPLSNLDAKLRVYARAELKKIHETLNATIVYVTHDQIEAMSIGDRIGIMNKGYLEQVGKPDHIYDFPINKFVAGFIGDPPMNFFEGTLLSRNGKNMVTITSDSLQLEVTRPLSDVEGITEISIGIRPEDIAILTKEKDLTLPVSVNLIENIGREYIVHLELSDGTPLVVIVNTEIIHEIGVGQKIWLKLDTDKLHIFDDSTGKNLIDGI